MPTAIVARQQDARTVGPHLREVLLRGSPIEATHRGAQRGGLRPAAQHHLQPLATSFAATLGRALPLARDATESAHPRVVRLVASREIFVLRLVALILGRVTVTVAAVGAGSRVSGSGSAGLELPAPLSGVACRPPRPQELLRVFLRRWLTNGCPSCRLHLLMPRTLPRGLADGVRPALHRPQARQYAARSHSLAAPSARTALTFSRTASFESPWATARAGGTGRLADRQTSFSPRGEHFLNEKVRHPQSTQFGFRPFRERQARNIAGIRAHEPEPVAMAALDLMFFVRFMLLCGCLAVIK